MSQLLGFAILVWKQPGMVHACLWSSKVLLTKADSCQELALTSCGCFQPTRSEDLLSLLDHQSARSTQAGSVPRGKRNWSGEWLAHLCLSHYYNNSSLLCYFTVLKACIAPIFHYKAVNYVI